MVDLSPQSFGRRQFLQAAATATGGMAIAFSLAGRSAGQTPARMQLELDPTPLKAGATEVNAWVVIEPDGAIILRMAHAEMGQGIYTALPMILAEELECDWSKVKVEAASANRNMTDKAYGDMSTHGSSSVSLTHGMLQQAGASARARLVAAAAQRWKVDPATCVAADSRVRQTGSRRVLSYGELAGEAAKIKLDKEPAIKTPDQFKLLGKSIPRLEARAKITGAAQYGIDVRLPGMVYAAVCMPPRWGDTFVSFDGSKALKLRGVLAVLPTPDGVAVVADSFWRAKQAAADLPVVWKPGPGAGTTSAQFKADYVKAATDAPMLVAFDAGGAADILANKTTLDEMYEVPYLAHAAMEPLNCTVHVQADRVDVWIGTQFPDNVMRVAAKMTGLKPEQVFIHHCFLGGGFGRRMVNDELPQAVALSKALGRPVKLVWTREDDMRRGRYRPQSAVRMRALLGDDGLPKAVAARSAVNSLLVSTGLGQLRNGLEPWICAGLIDGPYGKPPALKVEGLVKATHVPVMWWRGTSASIHCFVTETFTDELAYAAKIDPYEYRRRLLTSNPKALAVLDEAATRAGWGSPLPPGSGRGIAFSDGLNSFIAEVAEVTVGKDGALRVDRVVVAYDLGHVVHPRMVEMQLEGGVVFGLTAALYGEITVKDGEVEQGNFDTYRMIRMADCPRIECYPKLSGGTKWGGAGETGVPPIAAAVGNAVFAATGKRVRSLPFSTATLV
jgi:isoquinoline 1-oxidoreductase beta subunit